MKWYALLSGLIFLSICAGQSGATMWCGDGPGTVLDHPCSDSDEPHDSAVVEAVARFKKQAMAIEGVWSVEQATSATGSGQEIRVRVDPQMASCLKYRIPTSVDDIPIMTIPSKAPSGLYGIFSFPDGSADRKSDPKTERAKAYSAIVEQYGWRWLDLAGVIGIAPGICDRNSSDFSSDFTEVDISVQRQFRSAVRQQIPPTVNTVPIDIIPY